MIVLETEQPEGEEKLPNENAGEHQYRYTGVGNARDLVTERDLLNKIIRSNRDTLQYPGCGVRGAWLEMEANTVQPLLEMQRENKQ